MPGVNTVPQPQSIVEQLRVAKKKVRSRNWEKKLAHKTVSFRGISPELHQVIKTIALNQQVPVDDIARAFLEFGLQRHRSGRLTIHPALHQQRMTLFPEASIWSSKGLPGWVERSWNTTGLSQPGPSKASRKSGNEKSWRWPVVSFRGLPEELVSALRDLRQENHVPVGEIVTLFLTYSLAAYQSGTLVLYPQPKDHSVESQNGG